LAGGNHDFEESHAHARGEDFHRLRARGREALGEEELAARETRVMSPLPLSPPGCVPVIAASVEIYCHEKVICDAKEAVG
jgi:hypothetical protein